MNPRAIAAARLLPAVALFAASASADELLYQNPSNSSYTAVQSYATPQSSFPLGYEGADDFMASGSVARVLVHGKQCFPCQPADVDSVTVRFWEWTATGPGALVSEQSVAAGDPGLVYDPTGVDDIEITLPVPVVVDGPGFVSVQVTMGAGGGYWGWWISNKDAPTGSPLWWQSDTQGGGWAPYDSIGGDLMADLAFSLWGSTGGAPPTGSDPCGQWGVYETPNPAGASKAILRGVAAIADDDVWAVGEAAVEVFPGDEDLVVQALHWDGAQWTAFDVPVPAPYPGGGVAELSAVEAVASDDVWAAGTWSTIGVDGFVSQEVLIVHWDGSAWSLVPNAPLLEPGLSGAWIRGIEVIAPDDIWFVGDFPRLVGDFGVRYAGAIHWDGSDFTVFDTPLNNTDENGLSGVSAVASDDVWAVGGRYGDGFLIDPYVIHFDGTEWSLVNTPNPGIVQTFFDVEALATDDVWAVGQTNIGGSIVGFAMHWDGSAWSEVPFSGGSLALEAFAPDDIYAGGGGVSHWDGSTWSLVEQFPGVSDPSFGALDAAGPCKLFAVGRQAFAGDFVNAAAKLDADPWTDLGGASAAGPALLGVGNLEASTHVALELVDAPPLAPSVLVAGATAVTLPFGGATLVPSPDLIVGGLATDATGRLTFAALWAPGVAPGASLYVQLWSIDPGSGALVASNGLVGVTP